MKKDVARHGKNCRDSAKTKSPKICRPVPLHPIEINEPLEMVGADFVGPLPITENGNRYIMTFQDHFTRLASSVHFERSHGQGGRRIVLGPFA